MQELGPNQLRWIEALESGTYTQGTGYLNNNGRFCCLGVATELFLPDSFAKEEKDGAVFYYEKEDFAVYSCTAPPPVGRTLGLHSTVGRRRPNFTDEFTSLVEMNDSGKTFKEIATKLRAEPEKWFKEPK